MRSIPALCVLMSLLVLPACPDKSDDTSGEADADADADGDADADADADGDTDFAPSEGTWNVTQEEPTKNTCSFDPKNEPFTAVLTMNGAAEFSFDDGDMPLTCALSGMDFDCGSEEYTREPAGGLDAEIVVTGAVTGSFADAVSCTGETILDVTCEGADCAMVAKHGGVPCGFIVPWNGAFVK